MAYNFYPNYQYQPPYQTNSFQNGTSSNLIWVQGESGAKSFLIAPNQTVPLWDSEAQTIYIKSADASGMPSIKILDYTVRENTPRMPEISPQTDYATKNDISHLEEEITALKAKFDHIGKEKNHAK